MFSEKIYFLTKRTMKALYKDGNTFRYHQGSFRFPTLSPLTARTARTPSIKKVVIVETVFAWKRK